MKKITNLEKCLYKDILITLCWVIISIPLWMCFDLGVYAIEAKDYSNMKYIGYEVLNKADSILESFYDEEALMYCETSDILVFNDSNTSDNYSLILKISKSNNVDLQNVRINVNYEVDYLNNYHFYEDEMNLYYVIDSADMVASSQKYIISLWNEEISNTEEFEFDFVIV